MNKNTSQFGLSSELREVEYNFPCYGENIQINIPKVPSDFF